MLYKKGHRRTSLFVGNKKWTCCFLVFHWCEYVVRWTDICDVSVTCQSRRNRRREVVRSVVANSDGE